MSQVFALTFTVKPGSEERVADLFKKSGRPDHVIRDADGEPIGKLLRTRVFMSGNRIVRVVDSEQDVFTVASHMRQQQEVIDLERELEEFLEEPRDMSTPEAAADFFANAMMSCVLDRSSDE